MIQKIRISPPIVILILKLVYSKAKILRATKNNDCVFCEVQPRVVADYSFKWIM